MKNKKKLFVSVFSGILWLLLLMFPVFSVYADEENIGGVLQTNGEISFFDETVSSSTIDSSLSSDSMTYSSAPKLEPKPKGKLPSTGELVKKSLSISGAVLLVIIFFFYLLKYKKRKQTGGE